MTTATPGSVALRNSLDLARLADQSGYKRYWVAEHHNLANIASSSPEIMIGQIAAATSRIRVGSGGVMLPNHAPLMVAERFKVLEALFPGRIDLGLGRAPGTDPVTSYALRVRQDPRDGDEFLERFQELLLLAQDGFPEGHPFRNVHAVPADVALPPIWLLGSSGYSAALAAACGMGFAFAHHFADHDAASAMRSYRDNFKPSATLARPYALLGTAAIAADTDAEAERIAASAELHYVRRPKGNIARWNRRKRPRPILIRRSIASGLRAIVSVWRSVALIASRTDYWLWPRKRPPTKSWSPPWCSTMRRADIPTRSWPRPSPCRGNANSGLRRRRWNFAPSIGHVSAIDRLKGFRYVRGTTAA